MSRNHSLQPGILKSLSSTTALQVRSHLLTSAFQARSVSSRMFLLISLCWFFSLSSSISHSCLQTETERVSLGLGAGTAWNGRADKLPRNPSIPVALGGVKRWKIDSFQTTAAATVPKLHESPSQERAVPKHANSQCANTRAKRGEGNSPRQNSVQRQGKVHSSEPGSNPNQHTELSRADPGEV